MRIFFVNGENFVFIGARWILPQLREHLKRHPEADNSPTVDETLRCFVAMQLLLVRGREDELAAIVEETEAVHRMPFNNVLKNTLYNEPGCPVLLERVGALQTRLEERSGGEPPPHGRPPAT